MQRLSIASRSCASLPRREVSRHPAISVVIPTRDRPESLRRCLDALARQTALTELEVVVVDDGSAVPEPIAKVVGRHSFARLIRQDPSGPAQARNAGSASARGRVVCFTDDDCEPGADWAETLAAAIHTGVDAAAGRTLSADPESAVAAASELIAEAPVAAGVVAANELTFAPSNNLACRTEVLAAVPFDERYPAAAGEDRDWCARLRAAGYVLRAERAASVIHRPGQTLRGFLRQQVRYGRGAYRFRAGSTHRRLEPPAFYAHLIRRGFARGARVGFLICIAQVATAIGFVAEWRVSRFAVSKEVTANSRGNRRRADEVVEDVKRQPRDGEGGTAPSQQHAVEGVIEHDD
jgi:glycosyltransferase involved in cell wall biosynthesis